MLVTASIAGLTALLTVGLVWLKRIGIGAAIVVWTSGFTAAATTVAGPVNDLLTAITNATH
ncbi:hypothetical protein KCMC57_up38260 [Kitasatospora sp. CMC57]|uniref:Uncharacterized protein n=1 Tax=Kitasatospora sp. CMC57 TaxID=3231513 RepID=A0AB33JW30_9ACTN